MFQKDDFTAISSTLRQYLPERNTPYILDIDLDFFSTKNPFKSLHDRINLYDKLAPLYAFNRPNSTDPEVSTQRRMANHITYTYIVKKSATFLSTYVPSLVSN